MCREGNRATPTGRNLRVLVIDDEPDIAQLVATALSRHSRPLFEVRSAGTLADGLRLLDEAVFDAAVLDLGLSDSRGAATVETVRMRFPTLPIVVLSGGGDEETVYQAMRAGAQDYIAKDAAVLAILPRSVLFAVERKQGEDALRRSEEKYRQMVESLNDVIFTLNTDGVIIYVSPVVKNVLGYDPAQLVAHGFAGLIYPDDLDAVNKAFSAALDNRLDVLEFRMLNSSGDVRWVRTSSRPVLEDGRGTGIRGVLTDITARRRAEAGLRAIEAKYRCIVETAAEGVWVFDEQGRTTLVNRQMAAMLGYAAVGMTGRTFESYLFPEDREREEPTLAERYRRKAGAFEQRLRKQDGGEFWAQVSTGSIVAEDGRDIGFFAMLTDVTETKRAEASLRQSREALRALFAHREATREDERVRVARDIHDELGQNLTGLKMDLRWIERGLSRAPDAPEFSAVRARAADATALVDQTLATVQRLAAELRPGVLDKLGLGPALQYEARRFRETGGAACETRLPADLPAFPADVATALFRICQESLTNVTRHAGATCTTVSLDVQHDTVVLNVQDNGRGISDEELASPASLGLLGIKERADMLGGKASFSRVPEGGTLVTVRLPLRTATEGGER